MRPDIDLTVGVGPRLEPAGLAIYHSFVDHGPGQLAALTGVVRMRAEQVVGGPLDLVRSCELCGRAGHGRPRLRGVSVELQLSTARCGGHAVVAVARYGRIGVDVASIGDAWRLRIASGVAFSGREHDELASLEQRACERAMTRAWATKEAYTKALGMGAAVDFACVETVIDPSDGVGVTGLRAHDWRFHEYEVDGAVIVAATQAAAPAVAFVEIGCG